MGRNLREDEIALWQKIVKDDKPLETCRTPLKKPVALDKTEDFRSSSERLDVIGLQPFRVGEKAGLKDQSAQFTSLSGNPGKTVHHQMDKKKSSLMKKGKLLPERRIDLHGMTLRQAHAAVFQFILKSKASGFRLVLIISGKGDLTNSEQLAGSSRGVIRRNLPQWLAQPSLSKLILHACPAHAKHGGHGAYYVYLRR